MVASAVAGLEVVVAERAPVAHVFGGASHLQLVVVHAAPEGGIAGAIEIDRIVAHRSFEGAAIAGAAHAVVAEAAIEGAVADAIETGRNGAIAGGAIEDHAGIEHAIAIGILIGFHLVEHRAEQQVVAHAGGHPGAIQAGRIGLGPVGHGIALAVGEAAAGQD